MNKHKIKTPYWIVYCLPAEHYCGITNRPYARMLEHKGKRDTEGWFVLEICYTKEEARAKELEYHKKGYEGRKQQPREIGEDAVKYITQNYKKGVVGYGLKAIAKTLGIDHNTVKNVLIAEGKY